MAKILVVDDSLFARMNICGTLQEAGHETLQAGNGLEGLSVALRERPDCIFSDLLMPEMDGIGLLGALREHSVGIPVIVLTADIQETKRRQCIELGTAAFLSKPPKKDELLAALARVLSEPACP